MKILLFGVSNVGKTTIGKILADQLNVSFYDLDDEVKVRFGKTLEEFVNTADLRWRDQKRGEIIKEIICHKNDLVIAITPISYTDDFGSKIVDDDILPIELYDTPENIFSRLIFSDKDDKIYIDDKYKNEHKSYYIKEIQADLDWYGKIYNELGIKNQLFVNADPPEKVASRIVAEYGLKSHEK